MIKINATQTGIKATLSGFNMSSVSERIAACQEGSCECACDPEVMKKIDDIKITGDANNTTIEVVGDIDAETVAPMMQECLMPKGS